MSDKERKAYEAYLSDLSYQASMVDSSYGVGKFEGHKEGLKEGRKNGLKEGLKKGKIEDALNMLADDLPVEKICKYTGLPVDEVKQLQQKLLNNSSNKVSEPSDKYKAKRKTTKTRKK